MEMANFDGLIHLVRGQRVILGADFAIRLGIELRKFRKDMERNRGGFPPGLMFRLTPSEMKSLILTAGSSANVGEKLRHLPVVFTEQGVAVFFGLLSAFVRLRQGLAGNPDLAERMKIVDGLSGGEEFSLEEYGEKVGEVAAEIKALMVPEDSCLTASLTSDAPAQAQQES